MICPYCKCEFLSRHVFFCKSKDNSKSREENRAYYLEFNFPDLFTYDNLYKLYVNEKMSLPDIKSKFNIDYKNIQFMLRFHNIPIRDMSVATKYCMEKREKTNMERYGAKNVLSKGTTKYQKRNETVREKYGVDNVFQFDKIIEKIHDNDAYYLDRYGLTRTEMVRANSKKFFNSLTDEEKQQWHNKMSRSFSNKVSRMNKGEITSSKLENSIEAGLIELKIEFNRQHMITYDDNSCYYYDFHIPSIDMIIEVNGDYWHANPNIYSENHQFRGYTAKDKWKKDSDKLIVAENNGLKVVVIWESEIKKLKKGDIAKYLNSKILIYLNS